MAPFDRRDLEALLVPQPAPCVSVFLPAPGPMGARPSVRLRNLLREAEERPPSTDGATLMEPLAALARSDAWPHPAEGLALFRRRARGGDLPAMVVTVSTERADLALERGGASRSAVHGRGPGWSPPIRGLWRRRVVEET